MRALVIASLVVGCAATKPAAPVTSPQADEIAVSVAAPLAGHDFQKVRVRFVGAGAPASELAKDLVVTRGLVEDDALARDDMALSMWLFDHGQVEGTVAHRREIRGEEIIVTFEINPGPVYHLKKFDVYEDAKAGHAPALAWTPPFAPGEVFRRNALVAAVTKVKHAYRDLGHANVEADPQTSVDKERHEIAVEIKVVRNEIVFLEQVHIVGSNAKGEDAVRAKLTVKQGDRFNESAIEESQKALQATGWFSRVDVSLAAGSDKTKAILAFEVQAKFAKPRTDAFDVYETK